MFSFGLIAGLLLLIPLAVIMRTLLKTRNDDETQEQSAALYEQHLAEMEADIQEGLLSKTESGEVKKELQLSLLNQNKNQTKGKTNTQASTTTAAFLLIFIPTFVISVYQYIGQPDLIIQAELLSEFNQAETQAEKLASIEKMLHRLEQRLINKPDDVDAWLMLTNSYSTLERYPEALRAVDNLYRLKGDDPTVLLRYADILAMANDGDYTGKPTVLIHDALKRDPENASGLWLAGLAANERGDINAAIKHWKRLLPKLEEGTEPQQQIKQYIQLANEHLVETENTALPNNKLKPVNSQALTINVSLSEALINEANNANTLFIYAKALEGPPMPLAIVRKQVSDLPLQVVLDDSLAMMPNNKLSDHKQVQIIARISKNGNAKPEPGDLIGTINNVKTDLTEPLNLIIDNKTHKNQN